MPDHISTRIANNYPNNIVSPEFKDCIVGVCERVGQKTFSLL